MVLWFFCRGGIYNTARWAWYELDFYGPRIPSPWGHLQPKERFITHCYQLCLMAFGLNALEQLFGRQARSCRNSEGTWFSHWIQTYSEQIHTQNLPVAHLWTNLSPCLSKLSAAGLGRPWKGRHASLKCTFIQPFTDCPTWVASGKEDSAWSHCQGYMPHVSGQDK